MKKLLLILLVLAPLTVAAQTNIQYRITVDGVNTSWTYDAAGSKKDIARIDGLKYAFGVYVASLPTNQVALAIGPWLKQQHQVLVDDYTSQKQAKDNAATLAKLQILLTTSSDLLSNADLNNLATIAAKLP